MTNDRWKNLKDQLEDDIDDDANEPEDFEGHDLPRSEVHSMLDLTHNAPAPIPGKPEGVIVNAHREVRIKLYYGRVSPTTQPFE